MIINLITGANARTFVVRWVGICSTEQNGRAAPSDRWVPPFLRTTVTWRAIVRTQINLDWVSRWPHFTVDRFCKQINVWTTDQHPGGPYPLVASSEARGVSSSSVRPPTMAPCGQRRGFVVSTRAGRDNCERATHPTTTIQVISYVRKRKSDFPPIRIECEKFNETFTAMINCTTKARGGRNNFDKVVKTNIICSSGGGGGHCRACHRQH